MWNELKRNTSKITWTRLENFAGIGTPDLLGYANNRHFFTVELKVTKSNSVRFSPHQIAFHISHPNNSYILIRSLGQRSLKLFPGSLVRELASSGFKTRGSLACSFDACLSVWLACELDRH